MSQNNGVAVVNGIVVYGVKLCPFGIQHDIGGHHFFVEVPLPSAFWLLEPAVKLVARSVHRYVFGGGVVWHNLGRGRVCRAGVVEVEGNREGLKPVIGEKLHILGYILKRVVRVGAVNRIYAPFVFPGLGEDIVYPVVGPKLIPYDGPGLDLRAVGQRKPCGGVQEVGAVGHIVEGIQYLRHIVYVIHKLDPVCL